MCILVVKEGAIKTVTLEKTGNITIDRDIFTDRDKTPTGETIVLNHGCTLFKTLRIKYHTHNMLIFVLYTFSILMILQILFID